MEPLKIESEDFFYWSPEDIWTYPLPAGPEDAWFTDRRHEDQGAAREETDHE